MRLVHTGNPRSVEHQKSPEYASPRVYGRQSQAEYETLPVVRVQSSSLEFRRCCHKDQHHQEKSPNLCCDPLDP